MATLLVREDSPEAPQLARIPMPAGATAPSAGDSVTFNAGGVISTRVVARLNCNTTASGWEFTAFVSPPP